MKLNKRRRNKKQEDIIIKLSIEDKLLLALEYIYEKTEPFII
jgi:hypothetical protein